MRQRVRYEQAERSGIAAGLLHGIGDGTHNVLHATELARTALRDGVDCDALRCIASLGKEGEISSNAERDLHVWLRHLYGLKLELYDIKLELQAAQPK